MAIVTTTQLIQWAAALTMADSRLSLIRHRGGAQYSATQAHLDPRDLDNAIGRARRCSDEVTRILKAEGIDHHAIAQEMDVLITTDRI